MKLALIATCFAAAAFAANVRVEVNGSVQTLDLERYVEGVVAGESSVFKSAEALKAMAVAARTYALHSPHKSDGFDLCDKTHCQRYDARAVTARVTEAVRATAGEVLHYRGQPALTYYHLDCGGRTEDVRAVWPEEGALPYLASHADPHCVRAGAPWHWSAGADEIARALQSSGLRAPPRIERISTAQRTASGRARVLALAGAGESVGLSASSLRVAIGRVFGFNTVRSDSFNASVSGERVIFDGRGSGHGVGLCQLGADQMGQTGADYRAILAFYYQGTSIAKDIAWRRVTGERIVLYADEPQLLQQAERFLREAEARVKMPGPQQVELRVYPSLDSFRDTTGEPGWVAARTSLINGGSRIDMQPASALRSRGALDSTLRHEFVHVVLDHNTSAELPVWFREGLAAWLVAPGPTAATPAQDMDVRQRQDEQQARASNAAARAQVAALVARYGEGTVLGWLKSGLPREATNASSKQAATKSK